MKKMLPVLLVVVFAYVANAQTTKPNIVIIIPDDPGIGLTESPPVYIHQPGIDSLKKNGTTFLMDGGYSLCNPARYSMLTGMYAHSNGAYDNVTSVNAALLLYTKVLSDNGYSVAIIGKFTNTTDKKAPPGIAKWFIIRTDSYTNGNWFTINGTKKVMPQNSSQIIGDTAIKWAGILPEPFCLIVGEVATHTAPVATDANKNLYKNDFFPLSDDFHRYTVNFPSFYYAPGAKFFTNADTAKLKKTMQKTFATMNDISDHVYGLREALRTRGVMPRTIVLYVGDNGYSLDGAHTFQGKNRAQESTQRIPCIIEYPPLFSRGASIGYTGMLSIDIGPTVLDLTLGSSGTGLAAYTAQAQGTSVRNLIISPRQVCLYEKIKIGNADDEGDGDSTSPSFRAVRTDRYKYTKYSCDSSTEEFFNLVSDPNEDTNQVRNPLYATLVGEYRIKLDSMLTATNDNVTGEMVLPCHLISASPKQAQAYDALKEISIFPNPANETLTLKITSVMCQSMRVRIYNGIGILMSENKFDESNLLSWEFSTREFPNGLYFIEVNGDRVHNSFVVQH